ncbi:DUF4231 domain-containing protein [Actinoplanes sp. NPDC051470]|uniref:DUF4231 domain-containing protein n=1 Tax=Actinoplanes sp. NPDC051470 TaxID=3157224 RepID=UPI003415F5F1
MQDDLLYTEKTHFASAEHYRRIHRILGIITTVLSTAAAATIVADLGKALAGILALLAAIMSAVLTFMSPEKSAEQHLGAGRQLGALRVRLRQVIGLDLPTLPLKELRRSISDLAAEKAAIDGASPGTSSKHFGSARKKIKSGLFDKDSVESPPPGPGAEARNIELSSES